jgi:hypothetical protein
VRRAERARDAAPAITIERVSDVGLQPGHSSTLLDISPPGTQLVRRLTAVAQRAQRRYQMTIGVHHGFDPRRRSAVEHRVPLPARDVIDALRRDGDGRLSVASPEVIADLASTMYDPVAHEYRLPIKLHLAWSWPRLPMWLTVGELSTTRCTLRLSLRSRHRLRYPTRYFHAAHSALSGLETRLSRRA